MATAPAGAGLRILDRIVGWAADADIAGQLDELRHHGAVEQVHLDAANLNRRRLRVRSDAGAEYAVALPRDAVLADGAVLLLEPDRAVVVRAGAPQTMTLRPADTAAALRLGFLAGHLHWKIDQRGEVLVVHLDGPEREYTARIADLLHSGRVEVLTGG
jgi:urease accessory protein